MDSDENFRKVYKKAGICREAAYLNRAIQPIS